MAQKAPEKKMPSTQAKATRRVAKPDRLSLIHLIAQSAFLFIQGTVSIMLQKVLFFLVLLLQEYQLINYKFRYEYFPS